MFCKVTSLAESNFLLIVQVSAAEPWRRGEGEGTPILKDWGAHHHHHYLETLICFVAWLKPFSTPKNYQL